MTPRKRDHGRGSLLAPGGCAPREKGRKPDRGPPRIPIPIDTSAQTTDRAQSKSEARVLIFLAVVPRKGPL